jgi:pectate lyase
MGAMMRVSWWHALVLVPAVGAGACWSGPIEGVPVAAAARTQMQAFAGAEGFGREATGWRGGDVVKVTTLEDRGPGSLRACAEGDRPRGCIFEVGGTIEVDSTIAVASNVYLAGQTAPGDGVQLRLRGALESPLTILAAHDVVIRHLRLRPGSPWQSASSVDGIAILDSHDVILDHLSLQYSTDELLSIGGLRGSAHDITVQDSLLAWGLDRANHPKGKHSKGALICSMDSKGECGRISLLRNLFAHNRDRNPDVQGTSIGPVEIINNVFYDPISQFGEFYDIAGDLRANYIGNTVMSGPSTRRSDVPYALEILNDYSPTFDAMVYVRGNIDGAHRSGASEPEELVVHPGGRQWLARAPFLPVTVEAMDAEAARAFVLANAGATRPARDTLDRQAIEDVINRSGRVVDDAEEAGGWPSLSSGPVPADVDGDGMPGAWEVAHGADPRAFDPWRDADSDGWANLEDYLNERAAGTVVTTQ